MGSYLFRRLLNLIPILIGISFLSFVLINLSPSDPAEVAVRVNEVTPTEEVLAETRAKLGLDKPFLTRYVAWLNNSLHGDFGNRYVDDKPVLGEIQKALPATLVLAGAALCLTLVCSLSAGIVCALYEGTFLDRLIRGGVFLGTAMPSFWAGFSSCGCLPSNLISFRRAGWTVPAPSFYLRSRCPLHISPPIRGLSAPT